MRPALYTVPSLFIALCLAGCGGGGDSSTNIISDPQQPPQDGITGSVASRISGASLSVHDAEGEEIVLASGRTTTGSGSYSLVFSEFEITEGIIPPLMVTLSGTGATAVCDFDREGNNDCQGRDGSFVAFGESYPLPDDFMLRGIVESFPAESTPSPRTVSVNISAASDLAAHYALNATPGTFLTPADVTLGKQQALGIVEFVTGLNTAGSDLNAITITDLTSSGSSTNASFAVALFNASLHGQIDTEITGLSSYRRVLDRLAGNIVPLATSTAGQLRSTGTFLAGPVKAFVTTAGNFLTRLETASSVLTGAVASQTSTTALLEQIAGNRVVISLPADPASSDPLDQSRIFVGRLSEAIGSALQISQTVAFGGTANGAATVYEEQVRLINTLASVEVLNALELLDEALATALANDETELTGTNVTGSLSFDGNTVNLSTATSTTSNIQTGISVNITVTDGTRDNPGGAGSFNAADVNITVSQTLNDLTTQQRYNGTLQMTLGAGAETESMIYSGSLRSTSALNFEGVISVSNMTASVDDIAGNYDASFLFADGSELAMLGSLLGEISSYTVSTSSSTIVVDVQTRTITDMTATLNLNVDNGGSVVGGSVEAAGIDTGSMNSQGVITFTDNTMTALPAPII
jgi:hypothetical protein